MNSSKAHFHNIFHTCYFRRIGNEVGITYLSELNSHTIICKDESFWLKYPFEMQLSSLICTMVSVGGHLEHMEKSTLFFKTSKTTGWKNQNSPTWTSNALHYCMGNTVFFSESEGQGGREKLLSQPLPTYPAHCEAFHTMSRHSALAFTSACSAHRWYFYFHFPQRNA